MTVTRWAGVTLCLAVILSISHPLTLALMLPAFLAGSLSAPLRRHHED